MSLVQVSPAARRTMVELLVVSVTLDGGFVVDVDDFVCEVVLDGNSRDEVGPGVASGVAGFET